MGDRLRLAIGVMGNAASLLLYAAPILTFARVIRRKSTEEFSCIPYILALSNCLLYTWYGLPIVSYQWENFPVVTINGLGILLECSFIAMYLWFSPTKTKIKVGAMALGVLAIFTIIAVVSTFIFHDHHHRKVLVGSIGLVASIAMYGSPLVVVKQVIMTKSVEFMPFYLSLFSFLASSLWMAYGLLGCDLFLASPNLVGSPLGALQLILYCKYRKRGVMDEPSKWDLENNGDQDKSKQSQLAVNDHIADPKCRS
ncbi:bidirectional sugar transporter SWEET3b isoform X2 [Rhodamnia argentea]|uniref:Bidirectional sugar transporter SWEET n=1 Tax=Rhodamnia argentea TaxID=178133 RepID=A0A8B8PCR7_9MYRT|nr:bidirectional sugar transporter SWEET3b isoform X2 [Rhodamnia argentea]